MMTERQYNRIIREIRMGNICWVNGLLLEDLLVIRERVVEFYKPKQ